jgi:hypothetical protein
MNLEEITKLTGGPIINQKNQNNTATSFLIIASTILLWVVAYSILNRVKTIENKLDNLQKDNEDA